MNPAEMAPFALARQFRVDSEPELVEPFGSGHINDTFLVTTESGVRYILQRINTAVFSNPVGLMQNFVVVTEHVRRQMEASGISDLERRCLRVIPGKDGSDFVQTPEGEYWRMLSFIADTHAVDFVTETGQAFEAARAFGIFQRCLLNLNPAQITDSIPGFHDIGWRLAQLREAVACAFPDRLNRAQAEIELALGYEVLVAPMLEAWKSGRLPRRVTHNDTKLNNVLLDTQSGEGLCVIDLDTVMAGTVLFDFGDMVRTFTSPVAEDESDLSKVICRLEVFEALTKGYIGALQGQLEKAEYEGLVSSGFYMTLMMAIRFLADFLRGDDYYKVHHPEHNLHRCRNQLALLQQLITHREEMEEIVGKYREGS